MSQDRPARDDFSTTIWSTVIRAREGDEAARNAALERLFVRYRPPLLYFIAMQDRGSARSPEDVCHEVIVRLMKGEFWDQVNPQQGRFRTFLKACVRNLLADEWDKAKTEKRGQGKPTESLDETDEDGRALREPATKVESADLAMDRKWAEQVLNQAIELLRAECVADRRVAWFDALEGQLDRTPREETLREVAIRFKTTEAAVRVGLSRLRRRLGTIISELVRETVGSEADWREELRYLVELSGNE